MLQKFLHPRPTRARGFTLIEIMVTIGIILVLATILLSVGSSVRKNSQITTTRAQLKALEGICEQFERENSSALPLTYYDNTGQGSKQISKDAGSSAPNFVEILYRYPGTKDQLVNLVGDKLILNPAGNGTSAILDGFGYPIAFIPANTAAGSITAKTTEILRSSGPNGYTDWTSESSPYNADDILSTDAIH